jgi:hypothetical protein
MADQSPAEIVRHGSTLSILWGVLLIVFGMFAVGSPFIAAGVANLQSRGSLFWQAWFT